MTNKNGFLIRIAMFGLALSGNLEAQEEVAVPPLGEATRIMANEKPIQVPIGHAMPFVYDYNRDGKKDLIVGQFGKGKARIYLNEGTDDAPAFGDFTYLQAGGKDASIVPS